MFSFPLKLVIFSSFLVHLVNNNSSFGNGFYRQKTAEKKLQGCYSKLIKKLKKKEGARSFSVPLLFHNTLESV